MGQKLHALADDIVTGYSEPVASNITGVTPNDGTSTSITNPDPNTDTFYVTLDPGQVPLDKDESNIVLRARIKASSAVSAIIVCTIWNSDYSRFFVAFKSVSVTTSYQTFQLTNLTADMNDWVLEDWQNLRFQFAFSFAPSATYDISWVELETLGELVDTSGGTGCFGDNFGLNFDSCDSGVVIDGEQSTVTFVSSDKKITKDTIILTGVGNILTKKELDLYSKLASLYGGDINANVFHIQSVNLTASVLADIIRVGMRAYINEKLRGKLNGKISNPNLTNVQLKRKQIDKLKTLLKQLDELDEV